MDKRKKIRLVEYDYRSDGYYFVTVVTRLRAPLLSQRKSIIARMMHDVIRQVQGVTIDTLIVMPNHIHCIIVLQKCPLHLGEIIRKFKAKSSHQAGQSLWQANYYDHVIRNEDALNRIRDYIELNPEIEVMKFDKFYDLR